MKRFNKFLIKYSLIIIIVLMLIILWGVFYLLSGPMIYQGEAILGNWITILIFLVTVSAGVMPFVLNDRQSKIDNEVNNIKQNLEILKIKFSTLNKLEKAMMNMGTAIDTVYSLSTQLYKFRLEDKLKNYRETNSFEIYEILYLTCQILIQIQNSQSPVLFKRVSSIIQKVQQELSKNVHPLYLKEAVTILLNQQANLDIITAIKEWQELLGTDSEEYKIFNEFTDFIYQYVDMETPPKNNPDVK